MLRAKDFPSTWNRFENIRGDLPQTKIAERKIMMLRPISTGLFVAFIILLGIDSYGKAQETKDSKSTTAKKKDVKDKKAKNKEEETTNAYSDYFKNQAWEAGLFLLKTPTVQKDIKLDDSQKEKIESFVKNSSKDIQKAMKGKSPLATEDQRKKTEEVKEDVVKKLSELLKPNQSNRLLQIMIQLDESHFFSETEVGKNLGISDGQGEKIKMIAMEKNRAMMKIMGIGSAPTNMDEVKQKFKEQFKERQKTMQESNEKLEKELTPDQLKKLEKIIGKKVDAAKLSEEIADTMEIPAR
jgi:hypothetical protein